MSAIFEYRHVVRGDEIDGHGHANNVAFVEWMQSAAIGHSSDRGWTPERYREARFGWMVRTHEIEYFAEAFAGEEILVRTWIRDMKKITSLRRYRIERPADGALLAVAATNWVFMGTERRLPKRIPPEVAEAFVLVDEAEEPR